MNIGINENDLNKSILEISDKIDRINFISNQMQLELNNLKQSYNSNSFTIYEARFKNYLKNVVEIKKFLLKRKNYLIEVKNRFTKTDQLQKDFIESNERKWMS